MTFLLFFECVLFVCYGLLNVISLLRTKLDLPASLVDCPCIPFLYAWEQDGLACLFSACINKLTATFRSRYQLLESFAYKNEVYRERRAELVS